MKRALLVLAIGCDGGPVPTVTGAERAAIMLAADSAACAALPSPDEVGACLALNADRTARAGDAKGAWATCQAMAAGMWRDECHFLVTDAEGVVGDEAKAWCQQAGRFRLECVGHAIAREAQPLLAATPRGGEGRLSQDLTTLTARYLGAEQAPAKAHKVLVDHLTARDPERPFHAGVCGSAPPLACRDAYVERVRRAAPGPGQPWRAACGMTVSIERARQTGQPLWDEDAAAPVAAAWSRLCAR